MQSPQSRGRLCERATRPAAAFHRSRAPQTHDMLGSEAPHGLARQTHAVPVVVVGDRGVGKTSLVKRTARPQAAQRGLVPKPTVLAEFDSAYLPCGTTLEFADLSGDRHSDVTESHAGTMRRISPQVALVCFHVMQPESLKNALHVWQPLVRKHAPEAKLVLVGCGTADRDRNPGVAGRECVSRSMGEAAAQHNSMDYAECSVSDGVGIDTELVPAVLAAAPPPPEPAHRRISFSAARAVRTRVVQQVRSAGSNLKKKILHGLQGSSKA